MLLNLEERDILINNKIKDFQFVAMADEAGAGPLAGDLVIAAVILDPKNPIKGLNDSKKISEKKREILYSKIIENAIDYNIVYISPKEIDEINILNARMEGFKRAIEGLKNVEHALIDGNKIPKDLNINADYIIKGDSKFEGIAAASILAKVSRDRQIIEQSKKYPEYQFEKHKGYGTKLHKEALLKYGPCEIHRLSYKPVKESIIK